MLGQGGGRGFLDDVLIVGGLLLVQCVLAGYVVFVDHLLRLGADPLAVIAIAGAAFSAFFLPFAVVLERKKWPSKISSTLMAQFVLIALAGTTVFQELMLLGIKKTTPAIASAMPNLSPGLIFIVAACFRMERFDKACKYTQAKILGTLVCLVGAMAMSFLQRPPSSPASDLQASLATSSELQGSSYYDWILGCSYLFVAVIVLSFYTVLQAVTLISFPAPLTMCTITSAMGAVFIAILQVFLEGKIDIGSPRIDATLISGIVILGGVLVGACIVFQTWCLGKKGPLFVSIFGPVQTVCSAIFSAALFGQMVSLGSLAGIVLMFSGLYIVLWAKNNESLSDQLESGGGADVEKALLS
ncbi:WAT1-related protein At5g47470-like [Phragmites australis]|uniref:WAT1-related protein At5g47470-like n=1 Tax=Phragmites australis TaxID=29695 RepID=UPI002D78D6C3|nr:WAT1-related protein At5g47470-like [Phragmites australis]XP_062233827.1 WAT1-related protein At5g47470-like [Phragmites australis]XP_062233828.1 WAT1-related protein At5g47470-like [Phragmites australis]XP_062233829.1 WAT1-related protein At5g47470-like [Phragmites australis]XP_062233830.1 WAT1-related protein At5g47470-like [Phragmites australis]XP_062233831.1 WAT1-related protein At5g47470-like [Phragmites australis]XP_062233832.1 WAT1-related protein At5g47470-like [Phragmites australi